MKTLKNNIRTSMAIRICVIGILVLSVANLLADNWCWYYAAVVGAPGDPSSSCGGEGDNRCHAYDPYGSIPNACYACDVADFYANCNLSGQVAVPCQDMSAPCISGWFSYSCGTFIVDDPYDNYQCSTGVTGRACLD
jgi:hypothetical protein